MPLGASFFKDVPLVEVLYLVFTRISVEFTVGDSGLCCCVVIPAGSPSCGGGVAVHVFDIKPTELAHSFLFCSCVYFCVMALSTVFHSINSPDKSPLSHSVLPVLFLPYRSFQQSFFYKVSFSPDIILCG